jgi:hypothetical protein
MVRIGILINVLLMASPAWAAQPDDVIWQQLIGTNEARCSQNLVDSAREINRLRAQIEDLQKQLKSKEAPNAK